MELSPSILSLSVANAKKLKFQEKEYWFRSQLEKRRISWEQGADWMKLQRSNIFMTSFVESKKVNMYK
jgi:E3 ubiquitin-protein ligase HUWE1